MIEIFHASRQVHPTPGDELSRDQSCARTGPRILEATQFPSGQPWIDLYEDSTTPSRADYGQPGTFDGLAVLRHNTASQLLILDSCVHARTRSSPLPILQRLATNGADGGTCYVHLRRLVRLDARAAQPQLL